MRAVFAATVFVIFTTPFVNAQDNRSQGFDVAQMTSEVQLAVRIEISSTGLKTLSSDILARTTKGSSCSKARFGASKRS